MKIIYTPEEESEPWEFDFYAPRLKASAAEMIESRSGHSIKEIPGLLFQGDTRTIRAVLWYLMWTRQPKLKWETFDYTLSEVEVKPGRQERQAIREAIEKGQVPESVVPIEKQLEALAELDAEDEADQSPIEGKAPSPSA